MHAEYDRECVCGQDQCTCTSRDGTLGDRLVSEGIGREDGDTIGEKEAPISIRGQ